MQHRNLASERIRIGMNQADFAAEMKTTTKMVVKYESDAGSMPADFIKRASEFFGCTADYLLDMTEERTGQAIRKNVSTN